MPDPKCPHIHTIECTCKTCSGAVTGTITCIDCGVIVTPRKYTKKSA